MKAKLLSMVLASAIAVAAPVLAQQATDTAKPPAAQSENPTPANSSSADADDAAAAAAIIAKANAAAAKAASSAATKTTNDASVSKRAREAGWHPEAHNGEMVYCREDPIIGSRFTTRRCVHENQLLVLLEQAQFEKDALQSGSCNGASCNAGK